MTEPYYFVLERTIDADELYGPASTELIERLNHVAPDGYHYTLTNNGNGERVQLYRRVPVEDLEEEFAGAQVRDALEEFEGSIDIIPFGEDDEE